MHDPTQRRGRDDPAGGRRVVVTGVGPVSAIGVGRESFFAALAGGESGVLAIDAFATERYGSSLGALLQDFVVEDYLESEKAYLDPSSAFALAAMSLALEDAELDPGDVRGSKAGLLFGTAYGSQETMAVFFDGLLKKGPRLVKPFLFPHTYANTAISLLAIEYDLGGYHLAFSAGATSAAAALLAGYDLIRSGRLDWAFAGGGDACGEALYAGFASTGLLSPGAGGEEACRPFDRRANGFVLGEGCGILVLEELEHARARGARIHGELVGAAMTGLSATAEDGAARRAAMNACMARAAAGSVPDVVSASANGAPAWDQEEALAIALWLGAAAPDVPVTAVKSMIGETLGAGGALQAIAALGAIADGRIPSVVGLDDPDPSSGLRFVTGSALARPVTQVLSNSIDRGGSMVSLVVTS